MADCAQPIGKFCSSQVTPQREESGAPGVSQQRLRPASQRRSCVTWCALFMVVAVPANCSTRVRDLKLVRAGESGNPGTTHTAGGGGLTVHSITTVEWAVRAPLEINSRHHRAAQIELPKLICGEKARLCVRSEILDNGSKRTANHLRVARHALM